MCSRLRVAEGQTPEAAQKQFDALLSVAGWALPGASSITAVAREEGAPWWWEGEQDASESFLRSMGVTLDG